LAESLDLSEANGWAKYAVLQNQYNLVERKEFEADSIPVLEKTGLTALPFFSLAMGFLSGKYRPGAVVDSVRAGGVEKYQNAQGWAVVAALGEIAAELNTTDSAVALAWLRAQPTVSAPIASARTVEQMHQIMPIVELNAAQLAKLDSASA
jgi:aryl-alcohol dehydrogenase-like predicted oxidoreductase